MELPAISSNGIYPSVEAVPKESRFIEANTQQTTLQELQTKHLIPAFVKDNGPTISQAEFITTAKEVVEEISRQNVSIPAIRVSHPIKGRTFEARNKKVEELEDHEKTLYYERMAFLYEIPSVKETVDGKELTLCFGGVKAYNQDNLYAKSNSLQKFQFFMGYKVKVCTNLCIWTDGLAQEIKVNSLEELGRKIYEVVYNFDMTQQIELLRMLGEYQLSEKQFAQIIGKTRMYQYLPRELKKDIPPVLLSDSQVATVAKTYFMDQYFGCTDKGEIDLWSLYNLLTNAVKSSYIDSFLNRNVSACSLVQGISEGLDGIGDYRWFLN